MFHINTAGWARSNRGFTLIEEAVLTSPEPFGTLSAPIVNGVAIVSLPDIGPHETLVVDATGS